MPALRSSSKSSVSTLYINEDTPNQMLIFTLNSPVENKNNILKKCFNLPNESPNN